MNDLPFLNRVLDSTAASVSRVQALDMESIKARIKLLGVDITDKVETVSWSNTVLRIGMRKDFQLSEETQAALASSSVCLLLEDREIRAPISLSSSPIAGSLTFDIDLAGSITKRFPEFPEEEYDLSAELDQ